MPTSKTSINRARPNLICKAIAAIAFVCSVDTFTVDDLAKELNLSQRTAALWLRALQSQLTIEKIKKHKRGSIRTSAVYQLYQLKEEND